MSFSSGVKLGDLDDFLSPASECVKPVEKKPDIIKKKAEVAAVALSDCLACVGCVTSAETVLLTQQSVDEFLKLDFSDKTLVLTLSTASRKALAKKYNLPGTAVLELVNRKLHSIVKYNFHVIDMSFFENIAVNLVREEVQASETLVLSSHCPGFAVYAEKTQPPEITSRLSRVRSPDQIAGLYLKTAFPSISRRVGNILHFISDSRPVHHVVVSPCFDKKLEILRDHYKLPVQEGAVPVPFVDLVLTTTELIDLLDRVSNQPVPSALPEFGAAGLADRNSFVQRLPLLSLERAYGVVAVNGEGGGFAQSLVDEDAEWKTQRNRDLTQTRISRNLGRATKGGEFVLRAYGFRNIQNVVRRVLTGDLARTTRFAEVMACPSACTLGGGQPRVDGSLEGDGRAKKGESRGWWVWMKEKVGRWRGSSLVKEKRGNEDAEIVHALFPCDEMVELVKAELRRLAPEKSLLEIVDVQWRSMQSTSLKW